METLMDASKIMDHLPHRYPFLLVDRIVEIEPNKTIRALKNVTINEPFFQGHFPGLPVMPGVLIIEAMAQAGGVLAASGLPEDKRDQMVYYFMGIDKVKFRKPVVPGDQLMIEVELLKIRSKAVKMAGTAKVDGKIVAEAQMMASIGEK